MPCGGIYPSGSGFIVLPEEGGICFFCDKPGAKHFCDEWDCCLHARCVPEFLQTEEGKIVIHHGHEVYLDFSIEPNNETKE